MRYHRQIGRLALVLGALAAVGLIGCNFESAGDPKPPEEKKPEPKKAPDTKPEPKPEIDMKPLPEGTPKPFTHIYLGHSIYLEVMQEEPLAVAQMVGSAFTQSAGIAGLGGIATTGSRQVFVWQPYQEGGSKRRVLLDTEVCYRKGYLEHLVSYHFKDHESILIGKFDSAKLHMALVAAGAQPGKPAQFQDARGRDRFVPPSGDVIKLYVRYTDADSGKLVTRPGQHWVIFRKSKKVLNADWVFAGSQIYKTPDGEEVYAANSSGRVICVSNFVQALLDIPIQSSEKADDGYEFGCNTDLIPEVETPVTVILEPGPKK